MTFHAEILITIIYCPYLDKAGINTVFSSRQKVSYYLTGARNAQIHTKHIHAFPRSGRHADGRGSTNRSA
ncbi:hypothetical protein J4U06_22595, partial [Escherichia coli]